MTGGALHHDCRAEALRGLGQRSERIARDLILVGAKKRCEFAFVRGEYGVIAAGSNGIRVIRGSAQREGIPYVANCSLPVLAIRCTANVRFY